MTRLRLLSIALIGAGFGLANIGFTPAALAAGNEVRKEVGTPLQAASKDIAAKNFKKALSDIEATDKVKDKTPQEVVLIEQTRGSAAQGAASQAGATPAANEYYQTAIKSFEAVVASGTQSAAEQQRLLYTVAADYFQLKDYAKTLATLARYTKEGGAGPEAHQLLVQSYYYSGDFANAAKLVADDVKAVEKSGKSPTEDQLKLLRECYGNLKDNANVGAIMEKLVVYYPKPDYWNALLHNLLTKPGFSDRLQTDVGRLRLATGTLSKPEDYTELTQYALQDGVPGEAQTVMDKGTAAKQIGVSTGLEADREKRLQALVTRTIDEDKKNLPKAEADAAGAKDGNALVAVGFDYVGYGQFDKGIPLMEQGFQKGSLKHPEDVKLHIAYAYFEAGKKDKAAAWFKQVQGTDGTADLARLWLLQLSSKTS